MSTCPASQTTCPASQTTCQGNRMSGSVVPCLCLNFQNVMPVYTERGCCMQRTGTKYLEPTLLSDIMLGKTLEV